MFTIKCHIFVIRSSCFPNRLLMSMMAMLHDSFLISILIYLIRNNRKTKRSFIIFRIMIGNLCINWFLMSRMRSINRIAVLLLFFFYLYFYFFKEKVAYTLFPIIRHIITLFYSIRYTLFYQFLSVFIVFVVNSR